MIPRKIVAAVGLVLIAVASAIYYFFDPSDTVWMPRCLWKTLTSTDCPGCGTQRMIHALMHGDISAALKANAFAMCMLPVIVFLIWLELTRESHPRLYARVHRHSHIWTLAGFVLAWWILRNLLL